MITVLPKSPQQFASRADFDAWAKGQAPGKTITFVDGLPEAVTPRMVITLDADGASTAPQPKREPVDNAEVNAKVLAYLRSNPGTRRFKDIEAATQLTGAQLTDAKKALVKAGEVQDEFKAAMSAKMPLVEEQGT